MDDVSEALAELIKAAKAAGVKGYDQDETAALAARLDLDMTPEEIKTFTIDIWRQAEAREACARCPGLEDCPLGPKGMMLEICRSPLGLGTIHVACEKRRQRDENDRVGALMSSARVPESLRAMSLASYEIGQNGEAVEHAKAMILETLKERKGAVFFGPPGRGKTHLAAAILNNRMKRGKTGVYICCPTWFDEVRDSFSRGGTLEIMHELEECEFLILDDADKLMPSEVVQEKLYTLVNERYLWGRPTIVTANRGPAELAKYIGGEHGRAIVSRLQEMCRWFEIRGVDHRAL